MSQNLPIIIQSIVYRKNSGRYEVLLLKRNEQRGGFWNVVNGTFEIDESILESRKRELFEETGIQATQPWSDELHRFTFPYKGYDIVVLVYSVEVAADQQVVLNDEHTEYRWVTIEEALQMLKYDDDKKGVRVFQEMIEQNEK